AYEFIDPSPLEGISYYRLLQVNNDGGAKYFDVKRIVHNKSSSFYADAFQSASQTITMQLYSLIGEKIHYRVIDFTGRVVKNVIWNVNAGTNTRTLELNNGV